MQNIFAIIFNGTAFLGKVVMALLITRARRRLKIWPEKQGQRGRGTGGRRGTKERREKTKAFLVQYRRANIQCRVLVTSQHSGKHSSNASPTSAASATVPDAFFPQPLLSLSCLAISPIYFQCRKNCSRLTQWALTQLIQQQSLVLSAFQTLHRRFVGREYLCHRHHQQQSNISSQLFF